MISKIASVQIQMLYDFVFDIIYIFYDINT